MRRPTSAVIISMRRLTSVALSLASRGYVLETGRIVLADASKALLENPQVRAAYLGYA